MKSVQARTAEEFRKRFVVFFHIFSCSLQLFCVVLASLYSIQFPGCQCLLLFPRLECNFATRAKILVLLSAVLIPLRIQNWHQVRKNSKANKGQNVITGLWGIVVLCMGIECSLQ